MQRPLLTFGRRSAPVVPGPDGATRGEPPACVACKASTVTRVPFIAEGGEAIVVCLDPVECTKRYRKGASPASYAAALRGEILGVAP